MLKGTVAVILLTMVGAAQAGVYKCVNDDGNTRFQSTPCNGRESEKIAITPPPSNPGTHINNVDNDFFERERQRREGEQDRLNAKSKALSQEMGRQSRFKELIREKKVAIGMTQDQAVQSWGKPCDINRSVYSSGVHEQWVYCRGEFDRQYIYFEDGILTGMN